MRAAAFLWVASLVIGGLTQAQADDAATLVQRMTAATETLSYDGVFVYQRGSQVDAMRIVHQVKNGSERERLVSLSGPAREVVRDGRRVTCLFADDRAVMVEKSEPRDFLTLGLNEPVEHISGSYAFALVGDDRVAGRATTIINITPKQANRYSYRLWVDDQHGLLLKSVILNRAGQALEQVQFVQITIGEDIPDGQLEPGIEGEGFTWYASAETNNNSAAKVMETAGWSVAWLPEGFEMHNHKVQTMSESEAPVSHMVYSDGLAMVSVFVERIMDPKQVMQGYSSMGAVNAFSRVADSHQITVVGEVPLPTVRQIASSVQHR